MPLTLALDDTPKSILCCFVLKILFLMVFIPTTISKILPLKITNSGCYLKTHIMENNCTHQSYLMVGDLHYAIQVKKYATVPLQMLQESVQPRPMLCSMHPSNPLSSKKHSILVQEEAYRHELSNR